jgi:hypothetical protein
MNTSVEQLGTTYASCDVDAFEVVANEMMRLVCNGVKDDNKDCDSELQIEQQTSNPSPIGTIWS